MLKVPNYAAVANYENGTAWLFERCPRGRAVRQLLRRHGREVALDYYPGAVDDPHKRPYLAPRKRRGASRRQTTKLFFIGDSVLSGVRRELDVFGVAFEQPLHVERVVAPDESVDDLPRS